MWCSTRFGPTCCPVSVSIRKSQAKQSVIIACSLSGFGQDGPYRDRPGFDGIIQAISGAMSVTGQAGQPSVFMGFPVADLVGGHVAAWESRRPSTLAAAPARDVG